MILVHIWEPLRVTVELVSVYLRLKFSSVPVLFYYAFQVNSSSASGEQLHVVFPESETSSCDYLSLHVKEVFSLSEGIATGNHSNLVFRVRISPLLWNF